MMEARDALDVLAILDEAGITPWVDGGWGVDALVGEQHRDHEDLDLVVDIERLDDAAGALAEVGFAVQLDLRPTRVALGDRSGRRVDLHPIRFDEEGDGCQAGASPDGSDARYAASEFTFGWIGGKRVECISAQLQMQHHSGYEPRACDHHDVGQLFRHFNLALPDGYR